MIEKGWEENSDRKSEVDFDLRKDPKLIEENNILKDKIMKLTQVKEEQDRHLGELNKTLHEKQAFHENHIKEIEKGLLLSKNTEEVARDLAEKEEFISRLQKDNDNLQLENERLSTFIIEKQTENDVLRETIKNQQSPGSQSELLETLNQLKMENDKLRNTIAEIQLDSNHRSDKGNSVGVNSVGMQMVPQQKVIVSKVLKPHAGPDDHEHENTIFGPERRVDIKDLKHSVEV